MIRKRHILIIDPIEFSGGSKIATETILRQLNTESTIVSVITKDKASWQWKHLRTIELFEPEFLSNKEQGLLYFIRHFLLAINIFVARVRFGKIDVTLGASGPGVDLSLYLIVPLLRYKIIQLVHGPVARSRTIARCLNRANEVHHLQSTLPSIDTALTALFNLTSTSRKKYRVLNNGLEESQWPSQCQYHTPTLFWSASLLKWKGLETFIQAVELFSNIDRPKTNICYIRPKNTLLPTSNLPSGIYQLHWYNNPNTIDKIRATSNIFVSTSHNEPFGLSILESLAAGHCVLIPNDGAFWDKHLTDNIECIKYEQGDIIDLHNKIMDLCLNLDKIRDIGTAGAKKARRYRAKSMYASLKLSLEGESKPIPNTSVRAETFE